MQLAVDASVLVAQGLRNRGRVLLAHEELQLVVATEAWSETIHELPARVSALVRFGGIPSEEAARFLNEAVARLLANTDVVQPSGYTSLLDEARRRIPPDPNDAPTVALALALNCGIWTADRDFFGCGVPVWITETLQAHLAAEADA